MLKWIWGILMLVTLLSPLRVSAESEAGSPAPNPSQRAATGASQKTFDIMEYQVEGNAHLDVADIERAVYPYLGPARTIKDVEGARQSLEKAFHDKGYLTAIVNIPEQKVDAGVVTLKVLEAPVGKLRINGSHYYSLGVIRSEVPELAEGKVPDFNEVQAELTELNRSAELHVTPVLKASDTPGKVDVDLQVKDQLPLHASVELNDHYSANTEHLRAIGSVSYDNLFQSAQSINFQYQVTPQDVGNVDVYSLSYVAPLGGGSALALYGVHSNSNVAAVGDLSVIGSGDVLGLRWIKPLPGGSSTFYDSFSGGFDYKHFTQDVSLQGGDKVPSPVHYLPFSADYTATWLQTAGQSDAGVPRVVSTTSVDSGFTFMIPGINGSSNQFAEKRAGASATFLVFHPSVRRIQALPADWSLVGRLNGQLSSGPLISNEEFVAGGADSVRGYDEGEDLGDEGINGSLELRTPNWLNRLNAQIEKSYLLGFVEGANLRVRDPTPGQESHFDLASTGLGWRFKAKGLAIDLDYAHTLREGVDTPAGSNRGLFKVNYGF